MRVKYWTTGCLAMLLMVGCSNNEVIIRKQMEMEARLEQLVQGYAAENGKIADLSNGLKELQDKVRENSAGLNQIKATCLEPRTEEKHAEPEHVAAQVSPRVEVVNKETAPADKPLEAYMKAFGLYSADKYKEAVSAFESFISAFPDSEYAGNAQYWIGECYYSEHEYAKALEAFNRVIAKYPKGNKVPDAMLKLGYTYINLNEQPKAKVTLKALIQKYPKSQPAAKARERLGR